MVHNSKTNTQVQAGRKGIVLLTKFNKRFYPIPKFNTLPACPIPKLLATSSKDTTLGHKIQRMTKPGLLFLDVKKNKNATWYGTCAFVREPSGSSMVILRSYNARNKNHAQLLILHEWHKLLNRKVRVHWEIFPALCDISFLTRQLQQIQFFDK